MASLNSQGNRSRGRWEFGGKRPAIKDSVNPGCRNGASEDVVNGPYSEWRRRPIAFASVLSGGLIEPAIILAQVVQVIAEHFITFTSRGLNPGPIHNLDVDPYIGWVRVS